MKRHSKYSDELKRKAVQEWLSAKKSYKQITAELKIGKGQLSQWKNALLESDTNAIAAQQGELAPESTAPSAQQQPIEQLLLAAKSTRLKRTRLGPQAVADLHGGMPGREVAKKYGISTATVYAWSKAFKHTQPASAIVIAPAQGGRKSVPTPSPPGTGPNVREAMSLLRKAVARMNTLHCPHCGKEFVAKPQGLTENLVGMAHLFLEGEG